MDAVVKAGHHMSLAALQQHDPYINKILDVTGQVALYTFNAKNNEWEKTDIEGTLFVYTRSATPFHGFTIMNRLNMENLVEPINKDLEFQLQDPFLLYRNSNYSIYSIWFYDKNDCHRIAQLMARVVKHEALQAQVMQPDRTNSCVEERPMDILELLSRAKKEYQRNYGKPSSSTSEEQIQKSTKPASITTEPVSIPQRQENSHSVVKQITVEELFGSSLPKDPAPILVPSTEPKAETFHPAFPFEPHFTSDPEVHLPPAVVPLPEVKGVPAYNLRPSPVFPSEACVRAPSPLAVRAPSTTAPYLLSQLKSEPLGKPSLAPNFLPTQLATPQCFKEPVLKGATFSSSLTAPVQSVQQNAEVDVFTQSQGMKAIPAISLKAPPVVSGADSSVLLSPSMFQNSMTKTPELEKKPVTISSSVLAPEPVTPFSRQQLQETLIHLIKNDARFLSTIHEAYLQSISKDLNNIKL